MSIIPNTRLCRGCGCSDDDCRQCIELYGEPCHWVELDLCSRCSIPVEFDWEEFDSYTKHVHDWRSYVDDHLKAIWHKLPTWVQHVFKRTLQEAADREEWN